MMMGSANEKWAANGKAARQAGRGSHALRLPSRGQRGSLTQVLLVYFKMEFGTLDTDKNQTLATLTPMNSSCLIKL